MQIALAQPQLSQSSSILSVSEPHAAWYDCKRSENRARILFLSSSHRDRKTQLDCQLRELDTLTSSKRPLIAVVDDEPVIAVTLAEILMRHGFDAVWFSCPTEALDFVTSCSADLLLSDVSMPTMDGIALAAKILQITPKCVIFLLSARSHEAEVQQRVRLLDTDVHIEAKPVNVELLITTVRRMLEKH